MGTKNHRTRCTLTAIVMAILLMTACGRVPASERSETVGTLNRQMQQQQEAWNSGDLDGFMQHYWQSDSLMFIGRSGITRGWQATLDNYKKGYPDAAAMGRLQFNNTVVEVLSDTAAYVIGKWTLYRTSDTLGGHYSLLWKNKNGSWVIVADHSS
jgi:ketosteroid isomerase-like protein